MAVILFNQILKIELKEVIVLSQYSRGEFTLKLNSYVYSMPFIAFQSNVKYIFTPVNSYIEETDILLKKKIDLMVKINCTLKNSYPK